MSAPSGSSMTAATDFVQLARDAVAQSGGFGALGMLRDIIARAPPLGERWAEIAALCSQLYDDDAALAAARRLWQSVPKTVATAFILARTLEATGRAAEAVALLEPAAAAGRLSFPELFHLSRMLMFAGRLDDARVLASRLLQEQPANPFAWERFAQLKQFSPGDPDIDRLVALQNALAEAEPRARASGAWALAKAYVDIGDDANAARMLAEGAAAQRSFVRIDLDSITRSAQASLDAIPLEELAPAGDGIGARVVFILGPQRSGTTLVEQILSRHPGIHAGGELRFMGLISHALGDFTRESIVHHVLRMRLREPELDPWADLGRRYLALGDERFGAGARFTDKLLTNHLRIAVILRALPGARMIRCRRDPLDIAWSCWRAHFDPESAWNSSPEAIARHIAAYERLLDAWAARFPGLFVETRYEDLVRDPSTEIPRLLAGCGLPDHAATREPQQSDRSVMTSSFAQVRQPIHAGQVGASRRFPLATRALRAALEAEGLDVGG